jgi:hypothetical protein
VRGHDFDNIKVRGNIGMFRADVDLTEYGFKIDEKETLKATEHDKYENIADLV